MRIKKIIIENFRGIKLPLEIDFIKGSNYTSVVIYGRNGTGKSSIVEAWEWLLTSRIESLSKEGVSENDYPHRSCKGVDCQIDIELDHATIKAVKSIFDSNKITIPINSSNYAEFKQYCKYPNYLRYSDLQDFVFRTKTEKYRYIAKYFGLDILTKYQDDLQKLITRLELKHLDIQRKTNTLFTTLNKITGISTINEDLVLNYINEIATKHSIARITELRNATNIKISFENVINSNPLTKLHTEWIGFNNKLNTFYPVQSIKSLCKSLEDEYKKLKNNEENLNNLILSSLYASAMEVLPEVENKNKCPLCDSIFDGDLMNHINVKHRSLSDLIENRNNYTSKRNLLVSSLQNFKSKISAIQEEQNKLINHKLGDFFNSLNVLKNQIDDFTINFIKPFKNLDGFNLLDHPLIDNIENIVSKELIYKKVVSDEISNLAKDVASKTLAIDYSNLTMVMNNIQEYLMNSKKEAFLNNIISVVKSFFLEFTNYIQNKIQVIFTSISANVVEYFTFLEGSNIFIKNPQIKLISDKNKAVELEIEFVSEKITPAFKVLSESQINSFGLAIFLAAVRHLNNQFKFILLDDIVNSFDSFKRPLVAQLLANKFGDFQILLLTHDQIFFEVVQKKFPNWQRYKFTSWDYTTGPKMTLSRNYTEDIRHSIVDDEPVQAGQKLGRYLEWIFGLLNENLQTPIKYKQDNIYTLSELIEPLLKRFRTKLNQNGKNHILNNLFKEFEENTIFRNYCVHWKNESNQYTTPEIENVFTKWLEIETMLHCDKCKSFVRLSGTNNQEILQCNCTELNLKDNQYYP